jgi:hypothetical protein
MMRAIHNVIFAIVCLFFLVKNSHAGGLHESDANFTGMVIGCFLLAFGIVAILYALDALIFGLTGRSFLQFIFDRLLPK